MFVWEDRGVVHVRKDFLYMLKSQIWQNSWIGKSLPVDFVHTAFIYAVS